jgi:acyl carrier protein
MALAFEEFREFLVDELGISGQDLDLDTPLFSGGLIDSFSLVVLMTFIEGNSGVAIQQSDATLDNFDSIGRMIAFIERRRAESE